jgi:ATP-binding cassette subfamily F protein 3
MAKDETILRFEEISYGHEPKRLLLDEVSFNVRRGSKITIMGQNGAGKSTIFGLITGAFEPESGEIQRAKGLTIATARQTMNRDYLKLTVREYFEKAFDTKIYNIDPRIDDVLEIVNLKVSHDRLVEQLSGGQQARLLLAFALIQNPDLLLLDEPTNNLDKAGIEHLTKFLVEYDKTCMVISHDAEFLNAFTHGVLYLDARTQKVEQYVGNYFNVIEQIAARIEKENRKNALLAKEIQANKDKSNFFANKGGQMRMVAKRMREKAAELEEEIVDVRKDDKVIGRFDIPAQEDLAGEILGISSFTIMRPNDHKIVEKLAQVSLRKKQRLILKGPNGIGKTNLLESIAKGTATGAKIANGIRVGYYRQDFSNLDFNRTVYDELAAAVDRPFEQEIRAAAGRFLIDGVLISSKIGNLSEGQKGLVAFARLMLLKPGLLILDEPTNHINFRHLPVIAEALSRYQGAMVMVSHVPDFVEKIGEVEVLDLEK